jgi:integrase
LLSTRSVSTASECWPRVILTAGSSAILKVGNVHPKIVQERLGHAQISLTLETYSHVVPGMGREAALKLDGVLRAGAGGDPAASL